MAVIMQQQDLSSEREKLLQAVRATFRRMDDMKSTCRLARAYLAGCRDQQRLQLYGVVVEDRAVLPQLPQLHVPMNAE